MKIITHNEKFPIGLILTRNEAMALLIALGMSNEAGREDGAVRTHEFSDYKDPGFNFYNTYEEQLKKLLIELKK